MASGRDRVGIETGAAIVDIDGDAAGFGASEHGHGCPGRVPRGVQQRLASSGKQCLDARVDGRVADADDLDLGSVLILDSGRNRP